MGSFGPFKNIFRNGLNLWFYLPARSVEIIADLAKNRGATYQAGNCLVMPKVQSQSISVHVLPMQFSEAHKMFTL